MSIQPYQGAWSKSAPYVIPPVAAAVAIILPFRDMIAKSALQKGQTIPHMTLIGGMNEGLKAAPTVGAIVGTQMIVQSVVEKRLMGESKIPTLSSTLISSAIVGIASAPILAIFNGQTMGWTMQQSLRKFSLQQGAAIAVQETAFVGGLSAADQLEKAMRNRLGSSPAVDYTAAFIAGAAGSLAGHPANTLLTRWQSGLPIESAQQLMWGSLRKARAVGGFAVGYKLIKETMNSTVSKT